ncbi:MAG: helix-turn-helix domain-containing protein [Chloroflexota bacterium]|nr:helix-turn-helix domain-containing protein [Chloroflexota bacterium]
MRWTQEEIAAQLGTVREVVSRTLRAFVKEGVIKMERQHISVLDLEALERAAEL